MTSGRQLSGIHRVAIFPGLAELEGGLSVPELEPVDELLLDDVCADKVGGVSHSGVVDL